MKLRQKQDSDLPALEEIFRMNRGRQVSWLNPDRPEDNFEEQSRGEAILVAESAGEILGFVSVWVPDSFIHHLYVHRDHQGRGVGKLLVDEVVCLCDQDLTLKCVRANVGAMNFYLKTGWTEVSSGIGTDGEYALLKRSGTGQAAPSSGG